MGFFFELLFSILRGIGRGLDRAYRLKTSAGWKKIRESFKHAQVLILLSLIPWLLRSKETTAEPCGVCQGGFWPDYLKFPSVKLWSQLHF